LERRVRRQAFPALLARAMAKRNEVSARYLATQCAVSEKTIRAYLKGDFGTKNSIPNPDKVAQLALVLHEDPIAWMKTAGIERTPEEFEAAVRVARETLAGSTIGPRKHERASVESIETGSLGGKRGVVRAAVPPQSDFSLFFRGHFELLTSLLDYDWKADIGEESDVSAWLEGLIVTPWKHHALLGVYDVPGRLRSFDFIPYPCLHTTLALVYRTGSEISWEDFARRHRNKRPIALITVRTDPGDLYARSVGKYSPSSIHTLPRYDREALVNKFNELTRSQPNSQIAIITDSFLATTICRSAGGSLLATSSRANFKSPSFRLGIGIRRGDQEWRRMLSAGQKLMHRSAPAAMLQLYSDLLQAAGPRNLSEWDTLSFIDLTLTNEQELLSAASFGAELHREAREWCERVFPDKDERELSTWLSW